jgi:DNA-binding NtrC family response regulator
METFYPNEGGRDVMVLIIEDEKMSRKALGMLLADQGYTAEACGSAEEALSALTFSRSPGLAVIDLDLPGMNGADFVEYLSQTAPALHPVLVTAAPEERVAHLTRHRNIKYLRKPINFKDLLLALDQEVGPN